MQLLELKVPPLIAGVLIGLAMWWSAHWMPAGHAGPLRVVISGVCAAAGLVVALLGIWAFRLARTTVDPIHPEGASSVVTRGIFSHTRNPMYVGLTAVLLGWAVWLWVPWAFLGPLALVLFLTRFQIIPEERAMRLKFGRDYEDYCERVRRWL